MGLFNINYFNAQNQFQGLDNIPTPSTYSKVTLYGGVSFFDDLHGLDIIIDDTAIDALDFEIEPEFDSNTFMLALFNNDLQAGNITSLPSPITKWLMLRRAENDAKFTKLDELAPEIDIYVDRLAQSNETYEYEWIPVAGDLLGTPLKTETIDTDFNKIIILDPDGTEGYSLCLDLRQSEITTEEDLTYNDTRGKFQTSTKGNKKVHVGSVGALIESNSVSSDEIEQDIDFLNQFEEFITNGQDKIIKYPKGFQYRVECSNYVLTKKTGANNKARTFYVASFTWREINEVLI